MSSRDAALANSPASPMIIEHGTNLPATEADYGPYLGAGYENTERGDFAVPFYSIVQGTSSQILAKVPDARPGMIINSSSNEMWPAGPRGGIEFIPAYTDHRYVQRKAQVLGGQFVDSFATNDPLVRKIKEGSKEFGKYYFNYAEPTTSDRLLETYYLYGVHIYPGATIADAMMKPALLTFKSKSIPIYKTWLQMTAGNLVRDPRSHRKVPAPLFARSYFFRTFEDIGQGQKFWNWTVEKGRQIMPTETAFNEAITVYNAARIGTAKADEAKDFDDEIPF